MSKPSQKDIDHIIKCVKAQKTIWLNVPTKLFDDDFIKIKQLGNGCQYGTTYQCKRKKDGKLFAVKYLNKNRFYRINVNHRHRYLKAMCNEIDVLKTLHRDDVINFNVYEESTVYDNPYIIKVEDVYEDKSTLYIIMEECKGGNLFTRICQQRRLNEKQAANIMKQILSALRYMHEDNGIVHCNLKPEKILFLNKNKDSPLKVVDFGMSKVLPRLQYLTRSSGSPYYTAPEVIKNRKYNHSCDMWSVGVILYVLMYGYPPFYVDPQQYGQNERKALYEKIVKGFEPKIKETSIYGYGPWFPHHIKTSSEVKDLISKLLSSKVRKRYTAKEALTHPWIVNRANNDDMYFGGDSVQRLFRFHNICQYKEVIVSILRNQFYKMKPIHFHQLQQLFIGFDKNNDGIISHQQFESALSLIDVNIDITKLNDAHKPLSYPVCPQFIVPYWFRQTTQQQLISINDISPIIQQYFCDLDDITFFNAKPIVFGIQFSDLLNVLVYAYLISCDQYLYDAFRKLDYDDDGKISTEELKQKLKEIDCLGEWHKAIKLIEQQSFDQNGSIDYEEFLLNLHHDVEEMPSWTPDLFKKMPSVFLAPSKNRYCYIDKRHKKRHHNETKRSNK